MPLPQPLTIRQITGIGGIQCIYFNESQHSWNHEVLGNSSFFEVSYKFVETSVGQVRRNLGAATDPGFGQGGPSSDPPEKCVIWASEYNLGPQKWGVGGPRPRPPRICYWGTQFAIKSSPKRAQNSWIWLKVAQNRCNDREPSRIEWVKLVQTSNTCVLLHCRICLYQVQYWFRKIN